MRIYLQKLIKGLFYVNILLIWVGDAMAISLSLKDAVFLALRNNPDIQSSELDRATQKYALVVAKHAFQPNYALSASYQNNFYTINAVSGQSNSFNVEPRVTLLTGYGTQFTLSAENSKGRHGHYNPSVTLKIIQPLLQGLGKEVVEAALRNAFDDEEINKISLKKSVGAVIDQVVNHYLDIVLDQETLKIDESSLRFYERTVKNDQLMINAGRKPQADIIQTQAQVASQKVTVENDRQTLQSAKFQLLNDLGLDRGVDIEIPSSVDFEGIVWLLLGKQPLLKEKEGIEKALANNFDYRIAAITLGKLKRNWVVAKDTMRWKLNLDVSQTVGQGSGGGDNAGIPSLMNGKNSNRTVGLNLNIPIDDVNTKQALLEADVAIHKSTLLLGAQKRSVEIEAINGRNSVINSGKQWLLSMRALDLQARTVEVNALKQKLGRISTFELLDTQRTLTRARQSVVSNAIGHIRSLMSLNTFLGATLDVWGIRLVEVG